MSTESRENTREQRLNEIIAEQLQAEADGNAPSRQELLRQHPNLARELDSFFADHERMKRLGSPNSAEIIESPSETPNSETATIPPAADTADTPTTPDTVQIPGYEILAELGRGGMGVVFKARHLQLNRLVALKMILTGNLAGPADVKRFLAEAEAVAAFQHPNIVQVFDVGEHQNLPYMALEYIEGGSLADRLSDGPLSPKESAHLVEQMAHGMNAAHQAGIVHRDLKPANVLIGGRGSGVGDREKKDDHSARLPTPDSRLPIIPKITDFGLAKRVEGGNALTQTGAIMGTPAYMAPEQASGEGKRVGPAADVYALGAILYECLTGQPPFKASSPLDTLLQVVSNEPTPPAGINPKVPRDLETICLKCLHKEPLKRYSSAEALANDLACWREGKPIAARPVGRVERLVKWVKRRPASAAAVAAVVALFLVVGIGGPLVALQQATLRQEADDALEKQKLAVREAKQQALRAETAKYAAQVDFAYREINAGNTFAAVRLLNDCDASLRGWEYSYLRSVCPFEMLPISGPADSMAISPDQKHLVTVRQLNYREMGGSIMKRPATPARSEVCVWDLESATRTSGFQVVGTLFRPDRTVCFISSDEFVVPSRISSNSKSSNSAQVLKVYSAPSGNHVATLPGPKERIYGVCRSADSEFIAAAFANRTITVWSRAEGKPLPGWPKTFAGKDVSGAIQLSTDGKRLAFRAGNEVMVCETQTGKVLHTLTFSGGIYDLAFSPDDRYLAGGGYARDRKLKYDVGRIWLWDLDEGKEVTGVTAPKGSSIYRIEFRSDDRKLVAVSRDGVVTVWDTQKTQPVTVSTESSLRLHSVCISPDGEKIAYCVHGYLKEENSYYWPLWIFSSLQPPLSRSYAGQQDAVDCLAFSADGRYLVCGSERTIQKEQKVKQEKGVRLWTLKTGKSRFFKLPNKKAHEVYITADNRVVAAIVPQWKEYQKKKRIIHQETMCVWNVDTGKLIESRKCKAPTRFLNFAGAGDHIVTRDDDALHFWNPKTGKSTNSSVPGGGRGVAISPSGKYVATPAPYGKTRLWKADALYGPPYRTFDMLGAYTFSPDEKKLMAIRTGGTLITTGKVSIADIKTNRLIHSTQFETRLDKIDLIASHPNLQRLAAASANGIRIWDTTTGQPLLPLEQFSNDKKCTALAFSPDGSSLAAGFSDGEVHVWPTSGSE